MDDTACVTWLEKHLHPEGFRCPRCGAPKAEARRGGHLRRSGLQIGRCKRCRTRYTLYTGTVFAGKQWQPQPAVLFLRGVSQGTSSAQRSRELHLSRPTVLTLRHEVQRNAEAEVPQTPLPDRETETDEVFQDAGEKRRPTPAAGRSAALSSECPPGAWDVLHGPPTDYRHVWMLAFAPMPRRCAPKCSSSPAPRPRLTPMSGSVIRGSSGGI